MATILNPTPTRGTGDAFGAVPGQLGLPDPFGDLNKVAGGGLGALNKNLLTNLTSESLGVISPATRNALAITNAQRGQGSGMPLSGLSTNDLFGNIAGFSEGLQKQAADQYGPVVGAMSATQTVNPALQTDIANTNALRGAASDPRAKFNLAKSLYDEYAAKVRGPGGGISFGPQPFAPSPLLSGGGAAPTTGTDTRGINYGGTTYYGGATPGRGGAGGAGGPAAAGITDLEGFLGMGGVPSDTVSNPVTGTSNFDPFGGFGSVFAPQSGDALAGQGYGASAPAEGSYFAPPATPGTYAATDVPMAGAAGQGDLSSLGIDDALAQVFGV